MIIRESTGLVNDRIKAGGNSLADSLADGIIRIYAGTIPATGDAAITGTMLCEITLNSGAFTSGVATNGINLDAASSGIVYKSTSETWSGTNAEGGVATYGVHFANTVDVSASTTAKRFVFDISTSGAFMNLTNTTFVAGEPTVISTYGVEQPA